jgi:hypothetical protein
MASVYAHNKYYHDLGDAGAIPPGGTLLWELGPSDDFKDSTIVMTAHPLPVGGRIQVLTIRDTRIIAVATVQTQFTFVDTYVKTKIVNIGLEPVRYLLVFLTVIK